MKSMRIKLRINMKVQFEKKEKFKNSVTKKVQSGRTTYIKPGKYENKVKKELESLVSTFLKTKTLLHTHKVCSHNGKNCIVEN